MGSVRVRLLERRCRGFPSVRSGCLWLSTGEVLRGQLFVLYLACVRRRRGEAEVSLQWVVVAALVGLRRVVVRRVVLHHLLLFVSVLWDCQFGGGGVCGGDCITGLF